MMEEKVGFCTLCKSRCGTINVVENGWLKKVVPNPDHPTGKAICLKGRSAPEVVHNSRRLTAPLRRTTPKSDPDPRWMEISWDEALDEIGDRLKDHVARGGPESIAFAVTSGSSSPLSDSTYWILRFGELIERAAFDWDFVRDWTNAPCLVRSDNDRLARSL
ncbi:molybdopterin-dependent oxidoreductase [Mesorhizobium sp. LCM 4577]|uniref:molybdopterin-dependent oxidoreductase n=1 Tax=Mesorhizobium sp. LCM 4577 TaxID=1848288 RepID=UPI0009F6625F|nr:molybdopterin-dependent oxidoreductase [Mesorhizobium sp. LCM 4577]